MYPSSSELESNANEILAEQGIPPPLKPHQKFFRQLCPGAEMITEEEWNEVAYSAQFYQALIVWWLWKNWVSPTALPESERQQIRPGTQVLSDIVECARSKGVETFLTPVLVGFFVSISETIFGTKSFGPVYADIRIPEPEAFFRKPKTFIEMMNKIRCELERTTQPTPDIPSKANRGVVYDLLYCLEPYAIENFVPLPLGNASPLVWHMISCYTLKNLGSCTDQDLVVLAQINGDKSYVCNWIAVEMLKKRIGEDGQLHYREEGDFFLQEINKMSTEPSYSPSERFFQLMRMAWDL